MDYFIRKVDDVGRIVLPSLYRDILNINLGDPVKITLKRDQITITPHDKRFRCAVTGTSHNLFKYADSVYLSEEGAEILRKELNK